MIQKGKAEWHYVTVLTYLDYFTFHLPELITYSFYPILKTVDKTSFLLLKKQFSPLFLFTLNVCS